MLQSKAGYIDARPHHLIDEPLATHGRTIHWVIRVHLAASPPRLLWRRLLTSRARLQVRPRGRSPWSVSFWPATAAVSDRPGQYHLAFGRDGGGQFLFGSAGTADVTGLMIVKGDDVRHRRGLSALCQGKRIGLATAAYLSTLSPRVANRSSTGVGCRRGS
jgi:hypothetical protein